MTDKLAIISHQDCLLHEMGDLHPECPGRLEAISSRIALNDLINSSSQLSAELVTKEQLKLGHDDSYVDRIFNIAPSSGQTFLDPDTSMNPHSLDAARYAAGSVCQAVDMILQEQAQRVFCLVRPPGHHAEYDRAMGFCIFNSVAVGALYALTQPDINRVAVVDFDVHHGNGTENIVANKEGIQFFSTFQSPFYPFSGIGQTADNIHNSPLVANSTPADFRAAVKQDWLPRIEEFRPDLIIISAGFDAHRDDAISSLRLTEEDYAWVTDQVVRLANQSQGRIISSLEGGYNLDALATSVEVHLEQLLK